MNNNLDGSNDGDKLWKGGKSPSTFGIAPSKLAKRVSEINPPSLKLVSENQLNYMEKLKFFGNYTKLRIEIHCHYLNLKWEIIITPRWENISWYFCSYRNEFNYGIHNSQDSDCLLGFWGIN